MFNLEKSIKHWRKALRKSRALEDGYIDELESHLNDLIEEKLKEGKGEEAAFKIAVKKIGNINEIENEYYKSHAVNKISGRPPWQAPKWMPELFFNYLKTGLRIFKRYKGYSFINLFGLVIGITSCALIAIYIANELSYDKHHENPENIYRVAVKRNYPNQEIKSAATQRPLAQHLKSSFPEVINATRISKERAEKVIIRSEGKSFYEDKLIFSDNSLFEIFENQFIKGNPKNALKDPFSIVITEEKANKYFGKSNPIGKRLSIKFKGGNEYYDYNISGIIKNRKNNSHVNYDLIASYINHPYVGSPDEQNNWGGLNLYTYVQLQRDLDVKSFEEKLNTGVIDKIALMVQEELEITYSEFAAAGNGFNYFLQPLTSIHLHSNLSYEIEVNGEILYVYLFAAIAVMVLVLAGINFMNLSIARYSSRLREIGVRKVFGSQRKQLIVQFLSEAFILNLLALILSMLFVPLVLPYINSITGLSLSFNPLNNPFLIIGLSTFVLITGLLSNLYPAVHLSSASPSYLFRGGLLKGSSRANRLTKGMVVFQFVISISLIICTLVIAEQNEYLHAKKLGFKKDHVLIIEGTESILRNPEGFRNSLENHSKILSLANSQAVPGNSIETTRLYVKGKPENEGAVVEWLTAGFSYLRTFDFKLINGRDFNKEIHSDSMAVILNESAVKSLNIEGPIGKEVLYENRPYIIIGVVKDFHFGSLHQQIQPLAIFGPDPFNQNRPNQLLAVRISGTNIKETINYISDTWAKFSPELPIVFSFLDKKLDALYKHDLRTRNLFTFFTFDAILIACIGLFGLSFFEAQKRTKELGTRKVLGATTYQIIVLISRDFIKLVLTAYLIAVPIAYFAMKWWLSEFAYSIGLEIDLFIIGGVISISLAILTVIYQSFKAAIANPIEALKYE